MGYAGPMRLRHLLLPLLLLCVLAPGLARAQAQQDGLLAYQALAAGDFALAEFYASRALAAGGLRPPDQAAVLSYRGDARRRMGRFDEAAADYAEAIEIGLPTEFAARVLNNRGIALFGLQRFEEAIRAYEGALALSPAFVEAMDNLGATWLRVGDARAALEAFNDAVRLDPENARARNNRGRAYLDLEFYDEALADFTAALDLGTPSPATPLFNRGIAHERLGDRAAAAADFAAAQQLRPDEPTYQEKFREYGLVP
ncbi:MAG: tetratricopeptide repeat protein [Proteobacteria bacterium]|nr:tetratricopeptide repeat protein [Pseudomonadota bacterium]MDA1132261.1 tetratricopeptide repeat protein [Pseudomonadota bacterium]